MSDKELKSFKIGDNQRAGISSPVSSKDNYADTSPESQSIGARHNYFRCLLICLPNELGSKEQIMSWAPKELMSWPPKS